MRSVQKEQLLNHLEQVSSLTNEYANSNPNYVENIAAWLESAEKILQQFRHPMASTIATERGKVLAMKDGRIDARLVDPSVPKRKAQRIVASACLSGVVSILSEIVEQIDREFDQMKEKIAQLLAISSTREPIPMPPENNSREAWLMGIWKSLAGGETHSMYQYINTTLPMVDRLYILDRLLDNLLESVEPPN
ncbi:hypothetical protein IQ235_15375 [Oscillatoriales cyanobacterium LEGE 11467]|uniref:Uncharacterized protein n=1 Tax=Zarconia navalis LEGE 11467 TaxID=1828826 RepID=A0A928Z925_9CYAN|nr:hypothetical protein [Zarconia navalis]MBE9042160.1 hypothetical protein [Zarconia navalis LEGE 11467]